jgi:hypothetical protein
VAGSSLRAVYVVCIVCELNQSYTRLGLSKKLCNGMNATNILSSYLNISLDRKIISHN